MSSSKAILLSKSISNYSNVTLSTFSLEIPRIILSQINTHRILSKNTSSSRAIPSNTIIENLENNLFMPSRWGKNQPGMQAENILSKEAEEIALEIWNDCGKNLIEVTRKLNEIGLHKEISNRVSEAFQKVVICISGTEWLNFQWLRNHHEAQPEIREAAIAIETAFESRDANVLFNGDWHLPFYKNGFWVNAGDGVDEYGYTLDQARKISVSCCAQTSYRKNDDSLEKAERLFKLFFENDHPHCSPAEHQATPCIKPLFNPGVDYFYDMFEGVNKGVTHIDKFGDLWSGNFKNFIQYRQLIDKNNKPG